MHKIILFFGLLLFSQNIFAQIHYGIAASGGVSNILYSAENSSSHANYFTAGAASSLGFFILEKKPTSRLSFEQGIYLETTGVVQHIDEELYQDMVENAPGFDSEQSWKERSLQLTLPLKVKYDFEKWLVFHVGISNAFYIYKITGNAYTINKLYALRGEAGADFLLGKRIIAGVTYSRDLTPCGQLSTEEYYYYFQNLSFRIGYILK